MCVGLAQINRCQIRRILPTLKSGRKKKINVLKWSFPSIREIWANCSINRASWVEKVLPIALSRFSSRSACFKDFQFGWLRWKAFHMVLDIRPFFLVGSISCFFDVDTYAYGTGMLATAHTHIHTFAHISPLVHLNHLGPFSISFIHLHHTFQ